MCQNGGGVVAFFCLVLNFKPFIIFVLNVSNPKRQQRGRQQFVVSLKYKTPSLFNRHRFVEEFS